MPGRPKPTPFKVLEGNRGKRPLNEDEPKPRPQAPVMPEWLDAMGVYVWKKLAPVLERNGLLTEIDGDQFANLCQAQGRLIAIRTLLAETDNGDAVTVQEAAELLVVSKQTVLKFIKGGHVNGRQLPNGQWRLDLDSINKLLPAPVQVNLPIFTEEITVNKKGEERTRMVLNPLIKEERHWLKIVRGYAGEFGLTPRGRVGLSISPDPGDDGPDLLD